MTEVFKQLERPLLAVFCVGLLLVVTFLFWIGEASFSNEEFERHDLDGDWP